MPVNPWQDVHFDDELAFTGDGYTREMAKAAVAAEYAGMDEVYTCGNCGGDRAFYRATVGAVQCTGCDAVRRVDRDADGNWNETWVGSSSRGRYQ
jgi:hypothetical protein